MTPWWFVFDLDGTLLNDAKELPEPLIAKISALRRDGHQIMVATGRAREIAQPYLDAFKLNNDVILNNGAQVVNLQDHTVLFDQGISRADGMTVMQYFEHHAIPFSVSTNAGLFTTDGYDLQYYQDFQDQFPEYPLNNQIGVSWEKLEGLTIYKILTRYSSEAQLRDHQTHLKQRVDATVTQSMDLFLSVLPTGITKGTTLVKYLHDQAVSLDRVIVFGDNDNDIEMLSQIPRSYAMKNGSVGAQRAARYITSHTHNQLGVLITLENMTL